MPIIMQIYEISNSLPPTFAQKVKVATAFRVVSQIFQSSFLRVLCAYVLKHHNRQFSLFLFGIVFVQFLEKVKHEMKF